MPDFPTVGAPVVVWHEVPPSSTPREPTVSRVDHVAGKTFAVEGVDAIFNASTSRSRTVRTGAGAFRTRTYVAVPADSDRGRAVLAETRRRQLENTAVSAVDAWKLSRSDQDRRAAVKALQELGEEH